jgi:hypothetical protein
VIVWTAVVFVIAMRLGKNVRRVAIRKARRAVAASVLVGLCTASGCAGPVPDSRPWAVREEATLTAETKDFTEKADAANANADKKWAAAVDAWAALVAVPGAAGETVETILRRGETDLRERLRTAALDARLAARLTKEAEDERTQLAADKVKLGELTSGAKFRAVAFTAARCAGVGLLFGIAVSPYWRARRKEANQVKADAKKCPRCFSEKLVVEKSGAPPGSEEEGAPAPRYRGPKGKAKPMAKAVTEEGPKETGYVEC